MATNEQPMTDERLAQLRDEVDALADNDPQANMRITRHVRQMRELLAEIVHLRAREQALAAENEQKQAQIDAMRPIVEAVATLEPTELGTDWGQTELGYAIEDVDPIIEQACVFVTAHSTAGAAESEAK